MRATKPSPNYPRVVTKPKYTIEWLVYLRAKALLTQVAPNCEGKRVSPRASMEAACSQKGNPHQCHQSTRWTGDARSGRKSSISCSILGRSRPRLAGSHAFCVLQGVVYFSNFILQIFVVTLFEPNNKFITRVLYNTRHSKPPGERPSRGNGLGKHFPRLMPHPGLWAPK